MPFVALTCVLLAFFVKPSTSREFITHCRQARVTVSWEREIAVESDEQKNECSFTLLKALFKYLGASVIPLLLLRAFVMLMRCFCYKLDLDPWCN
jgi:hypothetical protein